MRGLGLIGLVIALLVVGLLIRQQFSGAKPSAAPTTRAQSEQIQQDIKKQIEDAMQTPRKMPDDN